MQILSIFLAIVFPRFLSAILWYFYTWFDGVFETKLWPILGFLFFPTTLLWYSAVIKWYAGEWTTWNIAILVGAVLIDISRNGYTVKKSRS